MNRENIGIIGAGAIGSILAAYLGKAGHEVHVVDIKEDIVDAINELGIKISGVMELHSIVSKAVTSFAQLDELGPDYIFICVKAYVLPAILEDLCSLDNSKRAFVSFQNGLGILKLLGNCLHNENLFRAVVNYAGIPTRPGHIQATFFHPPNYIGCNEDAGPETIEIAKKISSFLTDAGLETEFTREIKKMVWQKTILNSALMPTSVLTRLSMNKIMSIPETREIIEEHIQECLDVAEAEGYVYEKDFKEKAVRYLSTAGEHKTSMLLDFEAGNPIELDFLNARIQEYAEKHGISCRQNKLMLSLIKGLLHHRQATKNAGNKTKK